MVVLSKLTTDFYKSKNRTTEINFTKYFLYSTSNKYIT